MEFDPNLYRPLYKVGNLSPLNTLVRWLGRWTGESIAEDIITLNFKATKLHDKLYASYRDRSLSRATVCQWEKLLLTGY